MSDEKARELFEALGLTLDEYDEDPTPRIAAALRAARSEALEEAAVEAYGMTDDHYLAEAIRSLKDKQP